MAELAQPQQEQTQERTQDQPQESTQEQQTVIDQGSNQRNGQSLPTPPTEPTFLDFSAPDFRGGGFLPNNSIGGPTLPQDQAPGFDAAPWESNYSWSKDRRIKTGTRRVSRKPGKKGKGKGNASGKRNKPIFNNQNTNFTLGMDDGRVAMRGSRTNQTGNGTQRTKYGGLNINLSDPLDSTAAGGYRVTKPDGSFAEGHLNVGPRGVGGQGQVGGKNGAVGGHGFIGDREIQGGLTGKRNFGGGKGSVGGHLTGGLILDRNHTSMVSNAETAQGMDAIVADVAQSRHLDAWGDPTGNPVMMQGYDNGWQVAANLNAQYGVAGAKVNYHNQTQTSSTFHTTNTSIDQDVLRDVAGNVEATNLADLSIDNPGAYRAYMREKFGDRTLNDEGGRASTLDDLKIDALRPGEGLSLQTNSEEGGGGGVSVYGMGVLVDGAEGLTQRVVVHRNKDSTTFDISTIESSRLKGTIEGGGGVVSGSLAGSWADGSRMRFTFDDTDAGQEAMKHFRNTGMLPGSTVDAEHTHHDDYQRLSKIPREKWSEDDATKMAKIADESNQRLRQRDPNTNAMPQVDGVTYERHQKSTTERSVASVGLLGMEFEVGSEEHSKQVTRYLENNQELIHTLEQHKQRSFLLGDESGTISVNKPGSQELSITAEMDLTDEEREAARRLDGRAGQGERNIFGWLRGSIDRMNFTANKQDLEAFSQLISDEPFGRTGDDFEGVLNRKQELEGVLSEEVSDLDVMRHIVRKQEAAALHREFARASLDLRDPDKGGDYSNVPRLEVGSSGGLSMSPNKRNLRSPRRDRYGRTDSDVRLDDHRSTPFGPQAGTDYKHSIHGYEGNPYQMRENKYGRDHLPFGLPDTTRMGEQGEADWKTEALYPMLAGQEQEPALPGFSGLRFGGRGEANVPDYISNQKYESPNQFNLTSNTTDARSEMQRLERLEYEINNTIDAQTNMAIGDLLEEHGSVDGYIASLDEQTREINRGEVRDDQIADYQAVLHKQGGSDPDLAVLANMKSAETFYAQPQEIQDKFFANIGYFGKERANLLRKNLLSRDAWFVNELDGARSWRVEWMIDKFQPEKGDEPEYRELFKQMFHVDRPNG